MRLGPGKHLKGLTLMDGIVKPEEFDYFRTHLFAPRWVHRLIGRTDEQIITQEVSRCGARGYGDGRPTVNHPPEHLLTLNSRSPRWYGNWVAAGPELWFGRGEEESYPGGLRRKEVYLSSNIRSVCRI
jgi:hypothetical protein